MPRNDDGDEGDDHRREAEQRDERPEPSRTALGGSPRRDERGRLDESDEEATRCTRSETSVAVARTCAASSAASISAALANRSAARWATARSTTASTAAGMSARRALGGGTSPR